MGFFRPPPRHQGRQCLSIGLVVIAVSVAALCLVAPAQLAFATQPRSVGNVARFSFGGTQQSISSAHAGLTNTAAGARVAQLRASHGTSTTSSWSFRPGCLLLCLATASLAVAPKQRRGLQSGKAHHATARCSVAGFDAATPPAAGWLPGPLAQGSMPAAPATLILPPTAGVSSATTFKEHALPESGIMLPTVPVVEVSEASVRGGLSNANPALRVGTARCARRHCGIGNSTPRASATGRTRSARRAVGVWLQHTRATPLVSTTAFDPSRVRMQLQIGLQKVSAGAGQPHGFKLQSICAGSVELPTPRVGIINHSRKS
mmetsp:Transcript_103086/g.204700  ORF Transcript_103086/g.204700 Transcript_103086/m.204700 type:complete len:318 (+) Transcript_103086:56-1009(+)